ncbi:unnamed protein product, partial [Amoebophrya sp. A25]|eukprot:GSA25T00010358001.1
MESALLIGKASGYYFGEGIPVQQALLDIEEDVAPERFQTEIRSNDQRVVKVGDFHAIGERDSLFYGMETLISSLKLEEEPATRANLRPGRPLKGADFDDPDFDIECQTQTNAKAAAGSSRGFKPFRVMQVEFIGLRNERSSQCYLEPHLLLVKAHASTTNRNGSRNRPCSSRNK